MLNLCKEKMNKAELKKSSLSLIYDNNVDNVIIMDEILVLCSLALNTSPILETLGGLLQSSAQSQSSLSWS